jgi:hypothetical protein
MAIIFFINLFFCDHTNLHVYSFYFFFLVSTLFSSFISTTHFHFLPLKYNKQIIMVQVVETLRGFVTCDGHSCTHVVTGKARRTMNFCIALSSGYVSLSFVNQMTSLF